MAFLSKNKFNFIIHICLNIFLKEKVSTTSASVADNFSLSEHFFIRCKLLFTVSVLYKTLIQIQAAHYEYCIKQHANNCEPSFGVIDALNCATQDFM
jgi:hypothetical protein